MQKNNYFMFLNLFKREKYLLNYFCTSIVSHCNLNCRYCDHFVPLAKERIFSVEELRKHFKKLSSKINVQAIGIMGGEPLLHPDIVNVLKMFRSIFPYPKTFLAIYTNGILLNTMSDEFWECCHKNMIVIRISKFPLNIDFMPAFNKAKKYKVLVQYYGAKDGEYKTMYRMALDLQGSQNPEEMYKMCWQKGFCTYFQDGKLYKCTTAGNISNFNNYFNTNLTLSEKDYLDIYKIKNNKQIKEFFNNSIPFCKYCNIPKQVDKLPFEISKKDIKDWSY